MLQCHVNPVGFDIKITLDPGQSIINFAENRSDTRVTDPFANYFKFNLLREPARVISCHTYLYYISYNNFISTSISLFAFKIKQTASKFYQILYSCLIYPILWKLSL